MDWVASVALDTNYLGSLWPAASTSIANTQNYARRHSLTLQCRTVQPFASRLVIVPSSFPGTEHPRELKRCPHSSCSYGAH